MRRARQYAAVAAALLVGALVAVDASAHAGLVKSDPGRRETLTAAPTEIRLWFNEAIEEKFSVVALEHDGGESITVGKPVVDAKDPRLLKVAVPPLAPGRYTVRYRVLSVDGHVVKHGYMFRIVEKTAVSSSAQIPAQPPKQPPKQPPAKPAAKNPAP